MLDRLPEDAATLHAEALALLLANEGARGLSHLGGTFTRKTIRGVDYVYFQHSDPGGKRRQFAVGRSSHDLEAIVKGHAAGKAEQAAATAPIARLAGLLQAAGVATFAHGPARVLRALADAGLFAAGGVLMGSYAFAALGNLLAVRWPGAAWRTQDIDLAGTLLVAVPQLTTDVPAVLDSLRMGFVPVPELDPRHPSTSFLVRGRQLRVDLITPGSERDRAPIFLPRFRAAAAPLRCLSLALTDAVPAMVVDGKTATLVAVPTPARFALHKLLVSQMRSVAQQAKSGKDLHQAALLLEVLAEDRPRDLTQAARAFARSGPAVTTKVRRGLDAAVARWPATAAAGKVVRRLLH